MFNIRKVSYKSLKSLSLKKRMEVANSPVGPSLLAALTPSQFADLFPSYWRKGLPDVGGFRLAITRKSEEMGKKRQEQQDKYNKATEMLVRDSMLGTGGGQAVNDWREGFQRASYQEEGFGSVLGRRRGQMGFSEGRQPKRPQLTEDQNAAIDKLKKGPISTDEMKFLNGLSDKQLKEARIEKYKDDKGKEFYKDVPYTEEEAKKALTAEAESGNNTPREKAVLDMIAKREGSKNPNAIFGDTGGKENSRYRSQIGMTKPLQEMTVSEVLDMQKKLTAVTRRDGHGSGLGTSAVGSGQMVRKTLLGNLKSLGIPESQWGSMKFDKKLQDQLTLSNFRHTIGDPNGDPGGWNRTALGSQYESFDTRKGKNPLSQDEIASVRGASGQRPVSIAKGDYTPEEIQRMKDQLAKENDPVRREHIASAIDAATGNQTAQVSPTGKVSVQGAVKADALGPVNTGSIEDNFVKGMEYAYSNNSASKDAQPYKGVVFHVTGHQSMDKQIEFQKKTGYGYQYVIDKDGTVHKMSGDADRPNHIRGADASVRTGRFDLTNNNALGVGFITGGGQPTDEQLKAANRVLPHLYKAYNIPMYLKDGKPNYPVGHGEIQGKDAARNTLGPNGTPEGQVMAQGFRSKEYWSDLEKRQQQMEVNPVAQQPAPGPTPQAGGPPPVSMEDRSLGSFMKAAGAVPPKKEEPTATVSPAKPSEAAAPSQGTTPAPNAPLPPSRPPELSKPTESSPATPPATAAKPETPAPPPTAPKQEAPPPPAKEPEKVTTAAAGGSFNVGDGKIQAYPIGGIKTDNTVVVNKQQKPLFTMNTNREAAVYDPSQRRVDVMPTSKVKGVGAAPNPMSNEMNYMRQEMAAMSQQKPKEAPAPVKQVSHPQNDLASMMGNVNQAGKDPYLNPAFKRAMFRTNFDEHRSREPVNNYTRGNTNS